MAKKLNMKYTTSSSSILSAEISDLSYDLNNDSVQLIAITDEESEDNSESLNECDIQNKDKVICSMAQDEIDIIDARINNQKTNKKKTISNTMDKLMRHLQESFTPSSSSNVGTELKNDPEDQFTKSSNISSTNSWLNDIKLNKSKYKSNKSKINEKTESGSDGRKMSTATGVRNHQSSPLAMVTMVDGDNLPPITQQSESNESELRDQQFNSFGKQTAISYSTLMASSNEHDENIEAANNICKEKLKSNKETKKKFTLFDKFNKDDSSKSNNLVKLISPIKTIQTPTPLSTSITYTSLSPNNISSCNSQVFSNFLSTYTKSSTKANNANNNNNNTSNINSSRSASIENVNLNIDNNNQNINGSSNKNNNNKNKLPTSKSMMTLRKIMKYDESNNGEDDLSCIFSSFLSTICATQNPTIRRRPKRSNSPRQDSPICESNKDGQSSESSTSSSSSSINHQLEEISEKQQTTNLKFDNYNNRRSLWDSMTSSISFYYYIFLSMTLSSAFFFCISPLPSFLNGFIFGFLMTFFILTMSIVYLIANFFLIKTDVNEHRSTTMESVGLKRTKSKRLAVNISSLPNNDGVIYAGWVYEFIGDYVEREKNGFVSRLVYIVLSGSKLNLFVPSQEMNEKKLKQLLIDNSNRNMPTVSMSSQRVIDFSRLIHKRIALYLTKKVRNQRKYIWSKKYPICIEFNDDRNETNKEENLDNQFLPISYPVISKLVIFALTCREKEEWFWTIKTSIESTINYKNSNSTRGSNNSLTDSPSESKTYLFVNETQSSDGDNITQQQQYLHILTRRQNYNSFMRTNILNAEGIGLGNPGMMTALTWFNVLLNRLSFDILNKPNWSAYIAKKLQRKLKRLRLPYFMESLTITEIDIGSKLPKFNSVPSVPNVDDAGLWIEFDVSYSGGFTMTLETKINLLKLFANAENLADVSPASTPNDSPKLTQKISGKYWSGYRAKYRGSIGLQRPGTGTDINDEFCENDSDIDSIVTSSEDEEPETAPAAPDDADTDEKQKKLIRFVEKIASSQYFQKFFKKALEGVSSMSLTVQINSLNGILAINIPEPPSDRLWYGFRNDPTIQISARPKLGDHDLNLSYVTNFIEKKLRTEFFNYFVMPNMDDFFIPALNTSIEQYIDVVP